MSLVTEFSARCGGGATVSMRPDVWCRVVGARRVGRCTRAGRVVGYHVGRVYLGWCTTAGCTWAWAVPGPSLALSCTWPSLALACTWACLYMGVWLYLGVWLYPVSGCTRMSREASGIGTELKPLRTKLSQPMSI